MREETNKLSLYCIFLSSQFLEKTNQPKYILGGVTGLLQYDEIDILDMIFLQEIDVFLAQFIC